MTLEMLVLVQYPAGASYDVSKLQHSFDRRHFTGESANDVIVKT